MKEKKKYSVVSNVCFYLCWFAKYEPIVLVLGGVEVILRVLHPYLEMYLPKLTLDLVIEGVTIEHLFLVLGMFILLMILSSSLGKAVTIGAYFPINNQGKHFMGQLFLKSLRIPYSDVETGSKKKLYDKAISDFLSGNGCVSFRMIYLIKFFFVQVGCFFLYATVLSFLNWWLMAVLLGLSVFNYLIGKRQNQFMESMRGVMANNEKHFRYLTSAMGNTQAAKDIRIFGMGTWLLKIREDILQEKRVLNRKIERKLFKYGEINHVLSILRDLGAYAFLLYQTINGSITASEFVLYFSAISGLSGFVSTIMDIYSELINCSNITKNIREYLELPEENETDVPHFIDELQMPVSITFQDVCFSYQFKEEAPKKLFDHLNLTIRAGEKIALVGVNGAGKTTFVKLLCGMYEPDSGRILVNGIDRREFSKKEWYRLFSVVFQEPFFIPFQIGENLAMTTADKVDEERAWDALEKAGLKEMFEEKQIGLDSFMSKVVSEYGIDFSGGQQQKLLLARALYKNASVLVLDEPTAALDPIAENEVYENYRKYSENKTAIFISHRLASTRFSDRILMIEDGKILEEGTHEQLMKMDGAYAKMFEIQSQYY